MCSFGLSECFNKKSIKKKDFKGTSVSLDLSFATKCSIVRIIHAGGREELYQNEVPASQLMWKYPTMRVARPEVFTNPHESLLRPEEKLLPGHKYFLIPSTTAQKLKRKYSVKVTARDIVAGKEEIPDAKTVVSNELEERTCFAKDVYVSKEKWSFGKGRRKNKGFVPPISKARVQRELAWEPSLTSVQELSS